MRLAVTVCVFIEIAQQFGKQLLSGVFSLRLRYAKVQQIKGLFLPIKHNVRVTLWHLQ